MKFLDLFAGIGGMRSGLTKVGMTCVGHVELDKHARKSYKAIYSHGREELYEKEFDGQDITKTTADELPRADVWTFGAPCQDFSLAGQRTGLAGSRSRLVQEVFRLLRDTEEENRPTWIIYENVRGMLSTNGGWDFASILLEMGNLGYDVEWHMLNTKYFSRPQNRDRVYVVGHLRGRSGGQIFPLTTAVSQTSQGGQIKQVAQMYGFSTEPNPQAGRIYDPSGISPTLDSCNGGNRMPKIEIVGTVDAKRNSNADVHSVNGLVGCLTARDYKSPKLVYVPSFIPTEDGISRTERRGGKRTYTSKHSHDLVYVRRLREGIRRLTPRECWRLQGFEDWQFDLAQAAGVSETQLYKQAGNAATVTVVSAIGLAILSAMDRDKNEER